MKQAATFYIVDLKNIEALSESAENNTGGKKGIFRKKKPGETIVELLDHFSSEKIPYKWSGLAFTTLAVFCKEKMGFDWSGLEYHELADKLSDKYDVGVYIFSSKDEGLFRLETTGLFYNLEELEHFAADLLGSKPSNPEVMREAVVVLNQQVLKLKKNNVVILLLQ